MFDKFRYYFYPTFVIVYLIISNLPKSEVIQSTTNEYFPMFNFNLYSNVPNTFIHYDILFNKGSSQEYYLFYKNKKNNNIEKKYYLSSLKKLGRKYESGQEIDLNSVLDEEQKKMEKSIHFVRLDGKKFSTVVNKGKCQIKVLKQIK